MLRQRLQTTAIALTATLLGMGIAALGQTAAPAKKSTPPSVAKTATKSTAAKKAAAAPAEPAVELPAQPGLYAVMSTTMGTMVFRLFEDKAPVTVKNFVSLSKGIKKSASAKTGALVNRPFYNGLQFHRVIKNFMIQTGDIKASGSGNCGVPNIKDEFDPTLKFDTPGKLAMANIGEPNTGNCQIFITVGTPEHLNGKHTIFGEVVTGQDVAKAISEVQTGAADKPATPVLIKSVLIRKKE